MPGLGEAVFVAVVAVAVVVGGLVDEFVGAVLVAWMGMAWNGRWLFVALC